MCPNPRTLWHMCARGLGLLHSRRRKLHVVPCCVNCSECKPVRFLCRCVPQADCGRTKGSDAQQRTFCLYFAKCVCQECAWQAMEGHAFEEPWEGGRHLDLVGIQSRGQITLMGAGSPPWEQRSPSWEQRPDHPHGSRGQITLMGAGSPSWEQRPDHPHGSRRRLEGLLRRMVPLFLSPVLLCGRDSIIDSINPGKFKVAWSPLGFYPRSLPWGSIPSVGMTVKSLVWSCTS